MPQEAFSEFQPKALIHRLARQARFTTVQQQQYRRKALKSACRELRELDDEWALADLDGRLKIIDRQVKLWDAQRILCGEPLPRSQAARQLIEMPRPHIQLAQYVEPPGPSPSPDGLLLDSEHDAGSASGSVATTPSDVRCLSEREGTSDFEIPTASVLL